MAVKRILLSFIMIFIASPPAVQAVQEVWEEKYFRANKLLEDFYSHYDIVEENARAKGMVRELIWQYPDEPCFYDLWAFMEFILIGHELGIKIDAQADISKIPEYSGRVKIYYENVEIGFALTGNKSDSKSLLLRSSLLFAKAKFTARFEGGLSGLRRADKETADAVRLVAETFSGDKDFCPGYLLPGIARFGLAAKAEPWSLNRLIVRTSSRAYDALYEIDKEVFDKERGLEFLEKVYHCKNQDLWFEKFWLESAFFLAGAYANYRKDLKISEELDILENKELPLLQRLIDMFPDNKDLAGKMELARLRFRILKDYLSLKK